MWILIFQHLRIHVRSYRTYRRLLQVRLGYSSSTFVPALLEVQVGTCSWRTAAVRAQKFKSHSTMLAPMDSVRPG